MLHLYESGRRQIAIGIICVQFANESIVFYNSTSCDLLFVPLQLGFATDILAHVIRQVLKKGNPYNCHLERKEITKTVIAEFP